MKNINKKILALVSSLILFSVFAQSLSAQSYYSTWSKWKEANSITSSTWNDIVNQMDLVITAGKESYKAGDGDSAYNRINDAYYGWYETTGFERIAMGYISGARKTEMELQFSAVKAVVKAGGSVEEYNKQADLLSSMLHDDADILDGTGGKKSSRSAGLAAFLACFSIILREGFEAILIVGAIAAYLIKTATTKEEGKAKTRPVYIGAVLGIVFSFVTAWVLNAIKLANSASQEVIEGITALIAVCVLYYVSNWMLSKSEGEAWKKYITSKVKSSSEKNSMFALAFTSFLAVYREGAEVILFYQPMLNGDYPVSMVWLGFIVGAVCLVGVYIAIRLFSLRLPLKPMFLATSVLMFIMSIAFLGSGIKELIEGDVFTLWAPKWVSWIPSNPVLEIFGIYPCGQTVIAQLILLAITVVLFVVTLKRNKKLSQEMQSEN